MDDVRKSPHVANTESPTVGTPQSAMSTAAAAGTPPDLPLTDNHDVHGIGIASPFKRQRASVEGLDAAVMMSPETAQSTTPAAMLQAIQEPTASLNGVAASTPAPAAQGLSDPKTQDEDEEL